MHVIIVCFTCMQILVLLLMFFDVLIILGRNQRHLRVIRALRPLLLLDTHLMTGARRWENYIIITAV